MKMLRGRPPGLLAIAAGAVLFFTLSGPAAAAGSQALGYKPKYPDGFEHFDYVNPAAPKGGDFSFALQGSFDSLNPFLLKVLPVDGATDLVFESLMEQSLDEPYSQYGLLADDVRLAPDRRSVTFHINPKARFSDGTPVTADDVKFSFDTLKSKLAHPAYRIYWTELTAAKVIDRLTIRIDFARVNPELPLIAGGIPVFSRQWVGSKPFDQVTLEKPIGSGPYRLESFDLGKNVAYVRNPDYWARDLGVRRGMYNFDRVVIKYYRDDTVMLEALKAGEYQFAFENNSKQWALDYTGPKFDQKLIVKQEFRHHNDAGMQGFVFNLRRPLFGDRRVRRAIALAMDFEWANRNLFYNQYTRCDSYFSNSELASSGLPQGDELVLLEPFRDRLPPELFTREWHPSNTAPPHSLRDNLKQAKALLEEAGWHYRDGALRNAKGDPFEFEITLDQKAFERIIAPYARNLAKLGILVTYRTVDMALYQRKVDTFDFDMVVASFPEPQSPGTGLINRFVSRAADQEGSDNVIGIKNPVVDALVEKVIDAPDRSHLVTAVHALDRVLLNEEYLVPNWYINTHRVAYWDRFRYPASLPLYYQPIGWAEATWWDKAQDK